MFLSRFLSVQRGGVPREKVAKSRLACKPDESLTAVPFEIIPIQIDEGITCFKKGGKGNPDLLILSYNRSTEALFKSQQAKSIAQVAKENSLDSIDMANQAITVANNALEVAEECRDTASLAENKADNAERMTEFDEALFKELVESITIAADRKAEIKFKCGVITAEQLQ